METDPMRIGLILPTMGPHASPEAVDAAAAAAVRLGWSSVWVTDHLLVARGDEADTYGRILEALTTLAWVAGRHPGVRLGTSAVIPAMRDAPQLAKELATIDVLSSGRLIVAVGVGDRSDEPEWSNLGKADRMGLRGAYLDEAIALWRHLWAGRVEPFHGRFHQLESFVFDPLPTQGAALPIWSGGRSEAALNRAATLSDGYHASQTGPDDLRERWPVVLEKSRAAGRPRPTLSVRSRVRFDAPAGSVYSLHASTRAMVDDLLAFDQIGVDELVVVFDRPPTGRTVEAEMERFETQVVAEYRTARRELDEATRESYSM
jgi:alkanesulfonate monooxygenase SsuD/methylene tetrahydromethanopterin reductase-like flavin-dependent oxidoreductase (luciferase family)